MTNELNAARVLSDWESALGRQGEVIEIGRQVGTSPNIINWVSCRARVKGYRPDPLIGQVQQGEIAIRAFYPDLIANRFSLPVLPTDKVRVRGASKQINAVDNNTGRVGTTQIFVKIMAVG